MLLRNRVKNNATWGGLGGLCLAVSLIMNRFLAEIPASDFLQGMFIGLSLVFNIYFLINWRRERTA
jgi:hypothetical protein